MAGMQPPNTTTSNPSEGWNIVPGTILDKMAEGYCFVGCYVRITAPVKLTGESNPVHHQYPYYDAEAGIERPDLMNRICVVTEYGQDENVGNFLVMRPIDVSEGGEEFSICVGSRAYQYGIDEKDVQLLERCE